MSNQAIPYDLQDLAERFKAKVETGEVRMYTNKNLQGQGYKFDDEEQEKEKFKKKQYKK